VYSRINTTKSPVSGAEASLDWWRKSGDARNRVRVAQFLQSGRWNCQYVRSFRKVSVHFEYLENRWHGLDLTWQSVRRYLIAHEWTVTIPWG